MSIILLIFTIQFFAQSDEGKIVNYKFNSESFGNERKLKIFLPIEYELEPNMKFPVIYLLDAQNESLFNLTKSTIDYLIGSNELQPSILVGIISEDRQFEFLSENENEETSNRYKKVGGSINLMNSYLVEYPDITGYNFMLDKGEHLWIIDFEHAKCRDIQEPTDNFVLKFINGTNEWNPEFK